MAECIVYDSIEEKNCSEIEEILHSEAPIIAKVLALYEILPLIPASKRLEYATSLMIAVDEDGSMGYDFSFDRGGSYGYVDMSVSVAPEGTTPKGTLGFICHKLRLSIVEESSND